MSIGIVHVCASDTGAGQLDVLRTLLAVPTGARHAVVFVGPGRGPRLNDRRLLRAHAPLELPALGGRLLWRTLRGRGLLPQSPEIVLHAWSPTAARWCAPLAERCARLLIEADDGADLRRAVVWPPSGRAGRAPVYVCRSTATQAALRHLGVLAEHCMLIPPGAEPTQLRPQRRGEVRALLRLGERDAVVLALPPLSAHAGTLCAVWATLLLERVRPGLRLIVPSDGRAAYRLRRFTAAGRGEQVVRFADPAAPLPDLLAAADVAVYLPDRPAPLDAAAWALAAGCPLVTTPLPALVELLGGGRDGWLCGESSPVEAARQMLHALEQGPQARGRADAARARALATLTRARLVNDYRGIYAAREP